MKLLKIIGVGIALSLVAGGQGFASDGAALYAAKACIACHGPEGKKPIVDTTPKLAGQNKGYLVQQLKDIKSGARNNGGTAQMKAIAAGLNDADIEAIATYLSGL